MTSELVERLRSHDYDHAYNLKTDEELYAERDEAADRIEALSAENERLRGIPYRIWAEARDSEWDEGFNYAVKLFRAALGDSHDGR